MIVLFLVCFILQNRYQRHFVLARFIAVITNIWHLFFVFHVLSCEEKEIFQDKKRWKKEKNTKIYASLTKFSVFIIESKANWGRRGGGMNIQKEALITMSFSITFLFRFGNDDEGEALSTKNSWLIAHTM
jgi:hypothetical protein